MNTIYARNCKVELISDKDAANFLNTYHLQGYIKAEINIALKYQNNVVSLMSFGKPRYAAKSYQYELLRFCSSHRILGGAEKLFKYFINQYSPLSIISYCDLSKFTGTVYDRLGFKLKSALPAPSKHFYNLKTKKHITDNLLRQKGFDQLLGKEYGYFGKNTSNEELMLTHDFLEVYDCGQATYI